MRRSELQNFTKESWKKYFDKKKDTLEVQDKPLKKVKPKMVNIKKSSDPDKKKEKKRKPTTEAEREQDKADRLEGNDVTSESETESSSDEKPTEVVKEYLGSKLDIIIKE